MPGVVGAVSTALCEAEEPDPKAAVLTPAKLSLEEPNDVGDEVILTSVVLVELAAAEPWFANSHDTENVAPGATLVELSEMFSGNKSDWVGGAATVNATECASSLLVLLWLVTLPKLSAMTQT